MEPTRLKTIWREGGCALNCWLTAPSSVQAELLASLGFDSFVLDLQHGDIDYREAVAILTAVAPSGATALVRVPSNDPATIGRLLDAGAFGVICPMVNSRDDAESFVGACRYPPAGYRSWGPFRATLQARTDLRGYFAEANDSVVAIALIETAEGLANLDSILETPGLDGAYLGASDLAVAHGGQPGIDYFSAEAAARHDTLLEAARRKGVKVCLHAHTDEDIRFCIEAGADLVTVATDALTLHREAGRQLSEARRLSASSPRPG
jgi:4-hydroxy-2-oxoheptanedioate aldolase